MISRLHIQNYKCLKNEDMEFRPLTVLTGTNSSGKSSVLQAILLLARNLNPKNRERMYDLISMYQELSCDVSLIFKNNEEYTYCAKSDSNSDADILRWEDSLYFLTANRIGPEQTVKMSNDYKVGNNGEFLFGIFAKVGYEQWRHVKDEELSVWGINTDALLRPYILIGEQSEGIDIDRAKKLLEFEKSIRIVGNFMKKQGIKDEDIQNAMQKILKSTDRYLNTTRLKKQKSITSIHSLVNLWLSHITEVDINIDSIQQENGTAHIYFTNDEIELISPFNLGSGMSYLAKVLILCFLAKPDDVVMIENPEIHLHPRAQSRLGEFFAFMASKGIQLIIETHCEHLLSSLRYQVYTERLRPDDVILYYKADDKTPFEPLRINKNGRYTDTEDKQRNFPTGFFDVSVRQLLEIG